MKRTLIHALYALLAFTASIHAQTLRSVPLNDVAALETLIGTSLRAKPLKPRNVLVFWRCEGFIHTAGIEYGNKALEVAALKTSAFNVEFSNDYRALADEKKLSKYDAVVLNNTTHLKTKENPTLVPNLINFVKSGKGFCVIHAGADNFYEAPDAAEMVGGLFDGHPWNADGNWAFKLDEPSHPLNRAFEGKSFKACDEIYQQKTPPYDRGKVRVLVSLNMSDPDTANANIKSQKRTDNDFAVSWIRPYGNGRVFYTSFGHDKRAFLDKARLWHILDGLQYTLGDLKVDDTPLAP